jgi:L-aspartate oxidase
MTGYRFDTIIIGSGMSGLIASLMLTPKQKILIVTKRSIGTSSTNLAQGGIAAVQSEKDDFHKHAKDTLIAGRFHNKTKTVEEMIHLAPSIIKLMARLGVPFDTSLHLEAGHSMPRIAHVKDATGRYIEKTLRAEVLRQKNITIWENSMALNLITKNGTCRGVMVIKNRRIKNVFTGNVILATGGIGQIYKYTTNPEVATGDGIAMALRSGAKLKDMEFVQFHPTALLSGDEPKFLLSEALRGAGAKLVNVKKQSIMPKYDSRAELAPRDVVARAVFQEQKRGNVYLYIGKKDMAKNFPTISRTIKKQLKKNLEKNLIPITPAAHYLCGGVAVNRHGKTSIKNLYAIGECAYTGLHGANRLASNSLMEAGIMGILSAKHILKKQRRDEKIMVPVPVLAWEKKFPSTKKKIKLSYVREKIREIMWKHVGIERSKNGLRKAILELRALQEKLPEVPLNADTAEIRNMLDVSLCITKAALKRKKSLGCHFRRD